MRNTIDVRIKCVNLQTALSKLTIAYRTFLRTLKVEVQKVQNSEKISIMLYLKPLSMSIDINKANMNIRNMNFEEHMNYLEHL
jgi:hypothetical protein